MQAPSEFNRLPALDDLVANAERCQQTQGVLTRLATHQGAPYCLASIQSDDAEPKLMRISHATYDALMFGGSMRRRVVCRCNDDDIWSVEPEA